MEVGISETIQSVSKQANDLKAERSKMEDLFLIAALPPRAEIVGALRTFLSGGGTFRFFSSTTMSFQVWARPKLYRVTVSSPRLRTMLSVTKTVGMFSGFSSFDRKAMSYAPI